VDGPGDSVCHIHKTAQQILALEEEGLKKLAVNLTSFAICFAAFTPIFTKHARDFLNKQVVWAAVSDLEKTSF